MENMEEATNNDKILSNEEISKLSAQDLRLVTENKANELEVNAKRNWDLFYKRNETRFFKDRRWTTREFDELIEKDKQKILLEVGCGVGNFIYPLLEENCNDYFYYACDFSPRAIEFIKQNPLYNPEKLNAFQCDITTDDVFQHITEGSLDLITMIFVLSAIHPGKFVRVLTNLRKLLKPNGIVLFRDYGLYDMAQIRFKPGHKIAENFYMRQDGTRSYYFSQLEIEELFLKCGFEVISNSYVYKRTINRKESIDVPRIFMQGKFKKISS